LIFDIVKRRARQTGTPIMSNPPPRLVVASHNPGKVREIGALLAPLQVEVISAGALGLPEPEETQDTFVGNAALKARAAAAASGLPALSDDSGLEVFALGGAPGVVSARWAGAGKDFSVAMARVERELAAVPGADPGARFVCVLALAMPDGALNSFEGELRGAVSFPPRGENGFGYDPIFVPQGYSVTCGEIAPEEKHRISHRAMAFQKLLAFWS
jgi:XTP/dITP diphosphohydrolase